MKKKYNKVDEKVLIVENKPENIAAAKEIYTNATFVDNLDEAIENLKEVKYDAVISGLYLNGSENPEGVIIGKKCLEKNIPFAILAGEDKQKIENTRGEFFENKKLVDLVGQEDPLSYMIANANFEINKENPDAWDWAYAWANLK